MKKRFTLTEVLVVVFLIGVLTAIGFGMYSYAMNSAKESATRALFSRLNAALESCNTKFGYIPQSDGNDFSTIYVKHFTDTYTVPGNSGEEKEIGYIIDFEGEAPTVPGDSKEKQNLALWMEEFMKTIDLESLRKNLDNNGRLVDGWGNPIYYCYPGKFNMTGYDLYSLGADGRYGSDADELKSGNSNQLNAGKLDKLKDKTEVLCDDIFNF